MGIQIAAFNHLLNQHPAVRAELAAHAGRRIAVALPPLQVAGVLTDEGWLAACEASRKPPSASSTPPRWRRWPARR